MMCCECLQMDGCCLFVEEAAATEVPFTPTVALPLPAADAALTNHACDQRAFVMHKAVLFPLLLPEAMQRSGYCSTADDLAVTQ